jgi:L-amino acid N-acyltransferase YncA
MTSTRRPADGARVGRLETNGMEASSTGVRPASAQDAGACLAIYRPYVQNTAISWEINVPTVGEMAARIDGLRVTHEWLALERDDQIVGFGYGRRRRTRALHTAALRRLTERRYRQVFAGITQPNEASNGFHRSFGFQDAGLYRRVAWMQLDLLDAGGPDGPLGRSSDPPAASGPMGR